MGEHTREVNAREVCGLQQLVPQASLVGAGASEGLDLEFARGPQASLWVLRIEQVAPPGLLGGFVAAGVFRSGDPP